MEMKGWSFDINRHELAGLQIDGVQHTANNKDKCGTHNTWYGYKYPGDGKISATFSGSGTATLDYGNCFGAGEVNVYLNDKLIDTAYKNAPEKQIIFGYSSNDALSLSETSGIIKLNSLELKSIGKS